MNSWTNCFTTGPFSDMNFCEIVIFTCGLTYAYHYFLRFVQSPDHTRTNDHTQLKVNKGTFYQLISSNDPELLSATYSSFSVPNSPVRPS